MRIVRCLLSFARWLIANVVCLTLLYRRWLLACVAILVAIFLWRVVSPLFITAESLCANALTLLRKRRGIAVCNETVDFRMSPGAIVGVQHATAVRKAALDCVANSNGVAVERLYTGAIRYSVSRGQALLSFSCSLWQFAHEHVVYIAAACMVASGVCILLLRRYLKRATTRRVSAVVKLIKLALRNQKWRHIRRGNVTPYAAVIHVRTTVLGNDPTPTDVAAWNDAVAIVNSLAEVHEANQQIKGAVYDTWEWIGKNNFACFRQRCITHTHTHTTLLSRRRSDARERRVSPRLKFECNLTKRAAQQQKLCHLFVMPNKPNFCCNRERDETIAACRAA